MKAPSVFIPPEAFGGAPTAPGDAAAPEGLGDASAWDIAIRYHELKSHPAVAGREAALRSLSARAILDRARAVLGSVVHPSTPGVAPLDSLPPDASGVELDLEETLEASPALATAPLGASDLLMSYLVPRRQSVILSVDTSLSMTGEKLALTAVAIAVVLLQFPDDPVGIIAFENAAKTLKRPEERISLEQLVERFLDVPAHGYTHLEDGLLAALQAVRSPGAGGARRPASVVLLTDGKYTAGRDPGYLGPRFPHLVVLKMGNERASRGLCRELARGGKGVVEEVGELEALPAVMYGVVKDLLRGRSRR